MGKQEQMTPKAASPEPGREAPAAGGGADQLQGGGRPDRGLGTWYRTRSRTARLVMIATTAVTALVVALLALGATSGGGPKAAPAPARPAPSFSLGVLGHPGQHISLASYTGHPLIINFFASWCGPCQRETPLIAKFYQASHGRVIILGIDTNDAAAKAEPFIRKAGVKYQVVAAPIATALSYQAPVLPVTFFLNDRHKIVKTVYGAITTAELNSGVAAMSTKSGRS